MDDEGILTANVELAVAFQAIALGIDRRNVVPHPPQAGQALGVEQAEDAFVNHLAEPLEAGKTSVSLGSEIDLGEFDDAI